MKRLGLMITCASLLFTLAGVAFAQSSDDKDLPYVKRTTLAVRYVENKKTSVNLTGTSLAPRVLGKVEVEYKKNDARIKLKVENLDSPQTFGPFYTTFVVWAVTPEGQAENLMELPSGYAAEIQTQSSAQTFGVIISAEPHSAVKMPSQKVVAETTLPKNSTFGVRTTQAEYRVDKGRFYETEEDSILKADYTTPRLVLGARRSTRCRCSWRSGSSGRRGSRSPTSRPRFTRAFRSPRPASRRGPPQRRARGSWRCRADASRMPACSSPFARGSSSTACAYSCRRVSAPTTGR